MNFVKGEIVIMQNARYHTWLDGTLGVVLELLALRSGLDKNIGKYVDTWNYTVKVLAEAAPLPMELDESVSTTEETRCMPGVNLTTRLSSPPCAACGTSGLRNPYPACPCPRRPCGTRPCRP